MRGKTAMRTVRAPQLQCLIMTSYTEPLSSIVERPPAQRAARPRLRPRSRHARRPLPRRGLLARAAHAHERPVALRLRREEDRPAGQRRVDLAESRLHPLPQRLRLRALRVNTRRHADECGQEFRQLTSSRKLGFIPRS